MKNLKKLLILNFQIGKDYFTIFYGIYTFCMVLLFSILYLNDFKEWTGVAKDIFYIGVVITLLFISYLKFDKKLLVSIPIDNFKVYNVSLLIYHLLIFLVFFIQYFIITLFTGEIISISSIVWILNLTLFLVILKSYFKINFEENEDFSPFSFIYILVILLPKIIEFLLPEGFIEKYLSIFNLYNIDVYLFFALLFIFLINTFFTSNESSEKILKTKNVEKEEALNYRESLSFYKLILKIKSWRLSNFKFNINILIAFFWIIYIIISFKQTEFYLNAINLIVTILPILFIIIYDSSSVFYFLRGLPVDIKKFYNYERFIKLIIFSIANLIVFIVLYMHVDFNGEIHLNEYLSFLIAGLYLYCIYEMGMSFGSVFYLIALVIYMLISSYLIISTPVQLIISIIGGLLMYKFSFFVAYNLFNTSDDYALLYTLKERRD